MARAAAQGVQVSDTHSLHMYGALLHIEQAQPSKVRRTPIYNWQQTYKTGTDTRRTLLCEPGVPAATGVSLQCCRLPHTYGRAVPAGAALTHL